MATLCTSASTFSSINVQPESLRALTLLSAKFDRPYGELSVLFVDLLTRREFRVEKRTPAMEADVLMQLYKKCVMEQNNKKQERTR